MWTKLQNYSVFTMATTPFNVHAYDSDRNVCDCSESMSTDYRFAANRLMTFATWPKHLLPKKQDIASAGFIYSGESDRVKCVWCKVQLNNWHPSDKPLAEHYKFSKTCEFLRICYISSEPVRTPFDNHVRV